MARPIEKREQIEAGLVQAVARHGLLGATVGRIAHEAHVSPGLLYRYWKDRDQLARRVYRRLFSELMARLLAPAERQSDFWPRIRVMLTEFYAYADARPREVQFLLLTQHDLANDLPPEQRILSLLKQTIRLGIRTGAMRDMDRGLATQVLLGVALQPVIGAIYGDLRGSLSRNVPEVFDALRRALAPSAIDKAGTGARAAHAGKSPARKAKHASPSSRK